MTANKSLENVEKFTCMVTTGTKPNFIRV